MISLATAKEIANQHLSRLQEEIGEELQIADDETLELSTGWVFFYNSRKYLESGEFTDRLVGNGPFIINCHSGEVHTAGTAKPLEDYIAEYEERLS